MITCYQDNMFTGLNQPWQQWRPKWRPRHGLHYWNDLAEGRGREIHSRPNDGARIRRRWYERENCRPRYAAANLYPLGRSPGREWRDAGNPGAGFCVGEVRN